MAGLSDPFSYDKYWTQFSSDPCSREKETYDRMMAELAAIKGIPVEYYTLNIDDYADNQDVILGDNSKPKWDRRFIMKAMLDTWTPEVLLYTAFGRQSEDEITLYFHRGTFDKAVGNRSLKTPEPNNSNRRGGFGPVANDLLMTPHNGLVYEVTEGGLHFLDAKAQQFGYKFWYKVTGKVRIVSDAGVGTGEQYGAIPDKDIDEKYKGNPQFILPTPTSEELMQNDDPLFAGTPGITGAAATEFFTTASPPGPSDGSIPPDILLGDGRVNSKYIVPDTKDGSKTADNQKVDIVDKEVVDPQTSIVTPEGSPAHEKYGPNGRTIPDKRSLWGDW